MENKERVELHVHTKMSDFIGVVEPKDIIDKAIQMGLKAIAITDYGGVQSFPDAQKSIKWLRDFSDLHDNKNDKLKIIYGLEGYVISKNDLEISHGFVDPAEKKM